MAENVLKQRYNPGRYDSKIKEQPRAFVYNFVKDVRESGSTLKEQGILARILKELGNMETVAKGGKQQLRGER